MPCQGRLGRARGAAPAGMMLSGTER